jgi:hypothetical protein
MKKNYFLVLALLVAGIAFPQTNTATSTNTTVMQDNPGQNLMNPPYPVTNNFSSNYPGMNPNWSMTNNNYRAEYSDRGVNRAVIYDKDGNLLNREMELNTTDYPDGVNDYFTKNFPNKKYKVWSSEDQAGTKSYYSHYNDDLYLFDNQGKYVNKKAWPKTSKKMNNNDTKKNKTNPNPNTKKSNSENK